jgi:hypothetical protein
MTPQQQNALNAAQIQHDMVRRNLTGALQQNLSNEPLIQLVQTWDAARQAAGETIEYTPDALLAAGMIPGTAGLTAKSTTKVPTSVAPSAKNA